MGICSSVDAVATIETTAKVILPDGGLREYPVPVTSSQVLLRHQQPSSSSSSYFLCCADDMDLDGHLPAVPAAEELEAGQIYFVLPTSMLSRHLRPEELAALAVRASSTLTIGGDPYVSSCRRKKVVVEDRGRRRAGKGCCGRGRKFVVELSAIPE